MQFSAVIVLSLIVGLAQQPKPAVPVPVMSIEEALSKGLIEHSFAGTGGSSGDVMTLTIKRAVRRPLRLTLAPGTVLRSAAANVQSMIIASVKGERIDREKYRPTNLIELSDDNERVYLLEAYCLDFDKENPGASDRFSLGAVDGSALALINSLPKEQRSVPVVQAALWLAAGVSRAAIRERFEVSEADLLIAEITVVLVKGQ
jgi:hypothetical protein